MKKEILHVFDVFVVNVIVADNFVIVVDSSMNRFVEVVRVDILNSFNCLK